MQGGSSSSSSGVTPRALQHLFDGLAAKSNASNSNASSSNTNSSNGSNCCEYTVSISYLQIYCEMLQDLLQPAEVDSPALRYVHTLSSFPLTTIGSAVDCHSDFIPAKLKLSDCMYVISFSALSV
jgi:Kinesin motor domain